METANILVTVNKNYIPVLNVMLSSLLTSNPNCFFNIYLLQTNVTEHDISATQKIIMQQGKIFLIEANEKELDNAPTTSRYPQEIYFRIFAAKYLPHDIDRILYLDPDIIVNGKINELYNMEMGDNFFAAASHIGGLLQKVNEFRLDAQRNSPYINSGVMLMNLRELRIKQNYDAVFEYIQKHKKTLVLPDQDIISGLYGKKIISLNPYYYNMTERLYMTRLIGGEDITLDWIKKNSVIIHYCGRNKPWKTNYIGALKVFYDDAARQINVE